MGLTVRPVRIWMCSWHSVHASLHTQTCGFAVDRGLWLVSHGERFNNLHLLPQWLTRKTEKKKRRKRKWHRREYGYGDTNITQSPKEIISMPSQITKKFTFSLPNSIYTAHAGALSVALSTSKGGKNMIYFWPGLEQWSTHEPREKHTDRPMDTKVWVTFST